MRIRESRGDFYGKQRKTSLYRIAFIGDSFTYGQGVSPDRTLPARAENRFNEFFLDRPVQAVNLGVPGYNLLNAWLSFKSEPQIFDGLIVTVCYNDADLFCRSFKVQYQEPRSDNWEPSSPYGEAISKCFEDISNFCTATSVNVALCYHNCWDSTSNRRIAEILKAHCLEWNFPFIDGFAHLTALEFPAKSLIINKADGHPSAGAHDAVGRHIAEILVPLGWCSNSNVLSQPDRAAPILPAAVDLITEDGISEDEVLNWGLAAGEAKRSSARRLRLDPADQTVAILTESIDVLKRSASRWHLSHRLQAFIAEVAMGGFRLSTTLWDCQELRLKLMEATFALALDCFPAVCATLAESAARHVDQSLPAAAIVWPNFFPESVLVALDAAALSLEAFLPYSEGGAVITGTTLQQDYWNLARLLNRIRNECQALQSALISFAHSFDAATSKRGQQLQIIDGMVQHAVSHLNRDPLFKPAITALERIADIQPNSFTTVEVTLNAPPTVENDVYWLTVQGEYNLPVRLLFSDNANFLADGTSWTIKAYLPTLYAGRLTLRPWFRGIADHVIEVTLEKVEIYNQANQRRQIPLGQFRRDRFGQYVSTMIWVI